MIALKEIMDAIEDAAAAGERISADCMDALALAREFGVPEEELVTALDVAMV
ncbi:MAG: hypothetical protein U9Q07_01745 [Planctomycetota bacterium]|nr:hypothetical protein [Planctomycetota bacterium]